MSTKPWQQATISPFCLGAALRSGPPPPTPNPRVGRFCPMDLCSPTQWCLGDRGPPWLCRPIPPAPASFGIGPSPRGVPIPRAGEEGEVLPPLIHTTLLHGDRETPTPHGSATPSLLPLVLPHGPTPPGSTIPSLLPPKFCPVDPRHPRTPQQPPMALPPPPSCPPSSTPRTHAVPRDPNPPPPALGSQDPIPPSPASSRTPPDPPTHPAIDVQLCGLPSAHPTPQPFPQQLGVVAHTALIQTQLPGPPNPVWGL